MWEKALYRTLHLQVSYNGNDIYYIQTFWCGNTTSTDTASVCCIIPFTLLLYNVGCIHKSYATGRQYKSANERNTKVTRLCIQISALLKAYTKHPYHLLKVIGQCMWHNNIMILNMVTVFMACRHHGC